MDVVLLFVAKNLPKYQSNILHPKMSQTARNFSATLPIFAQLLPQI